MIVCTQGVHGGPARPRASPRRRRLDLEALSPRGGRWRGSRPWSAATAAASGEDLGPLVGGELEIRPDRFQAYVARRSLDFTRREFELLGILAEPAGKVLERDEIYRRVWGYEMTHGDRSVDVFVRKLRSKIQKRSPGWDYIHTHFGIGYRFEPEPVAPGADWLRAAGTALSTRRARPRRPRP